MYHLGDIQPARSRSHKMQAVTYDLQLWVKVIAKAMLQWATSMVLTSGGLEGIKTV